MRDEDDKQDLSPDGMLRECYVPDGVANLSALVLMGVPLAAGAAAGGCVLDLLYQRGLFYLLLVVAVAGCLLGWAASRAVKAAHCRDPWTAAGLGALLGMACFVASLYAGLVRSSPPGIVPSPLQLPRYIIVRMNSQRIQVNRMPGEAPRRDPPGRVDIAFNYAFLGIQCWALLFIPARMAFSQARRPYSADLSQWYRRAEFRIRPGIGTAAIRALVDGKTVEFVQILAAGKTAQASRYLCALDFVDAQHRSPLEFPCYLTVNDDAAHGAGIGLPQVLLTAEECQAVQPLFPELAGTPVAAHVAPSAPFTPATFQSPAAPPGTATPAEKRVARIESVEAPRAGTILSQRNRNRIALLGRLPMIWLIVSFPIGFSGGLFFSLEGPAVLAIPFFLMLASGLASMLLHVCWYSRAREGARWGTLVQAELQSRPKALVRPADSRTELVGILDVEASMRRQRRIREDIGLLRIDETDRTMLIEGDARRYWIPRESIVEVRPSLLTADDRDSLFLELLIRTAVGIHTLWLDVTPREVRAYGRKRHARHVDEVLRRIATLLD